MYLPGCRVDLTASRIARFYRPLRSRDTASCDPSLHRMLEVYHVPWGGWQPVADNMQENAGSPVLSNLCKELYQRQVSALLVQQ